MHMLDKTKNMLVLACVLLAGCSQSVAVTDNNDKPDWVDGEPGKYPNASYVYATGSASTAELARDRALGNLAKVFELQIQESSTTTQDVQTLKSDDVESVESSARIASTINIQTDKMIKGARVAEQWQNPEELTHYALAVLDRTQAENNIRGELNRLDREIAFTMNNAGSRQDLLARIADLQHAIEMQTERDSLQSTLKIIDLDGIGKPSGWSLAELSEQQAEALKSLNMRGVVVTDTVGQLDKVLQAAMAKAGFAASSGEVGYTLAASMETQEPEQKEGWFWLRGALNIRLTNPEGTVLGNKSWPLKVSALQKNQLKQRMLAEVENKLDTGLKSTVLGFATGEQ
jgi:hypothetical protein